VLDDLLLFRTNLSFVMPGLDLVKPGNDEREVVAGGIKPE